MGSLFANDIITLINKNPNKNWEKVLKQLASTYNFLDYR